MANSWLIAPKGCAPFRTPRRCGRTPPQPAHLALKLVLAVREGRRCPSRQWADLAARLGAFHHMLKAFPAHRQRWT